MQRNRPTVRWTPAIRQLHHTQLRHVANQNHARPPCRTLSARALRETLTTIANANTICSPQNEVTATLPCLSISTPRWIAICMPSNYRANSTHYVSPSQVCRDKHHNCSSLFLSLKEQNNITWLSVIFTKGFIKNKGSLPTVLVNKLDSIRFSKY